MLIRDLVSLKGYKMVIYLIVIGMPNFDVILNINFRSRYRVQINCRKKKVKFSLDSAKQFTFREDWVFNMIINSVKAKKMLSKGSMTYLAHISSKPDEAISSVKDILVV